MKCLCCGMEKEELTKIVLSDLYDVLLCKKCINIIIGNLFLNKNDTNKKYLKDAKIHSIKEELYKVLEFKELEKIKEFAKIISDMRCEKGQVKPLSFANIIDKIKEETKEVEEAYLDYRRIDQTDEENLSRKVKEYKMEIGDLMICCFLLVSLLEEEFDRKFPIGHLLYDTMLKNVKRVQD